MLRPTVRKRGAVRHSGDFTPKSVLFAWMKKQINDQGDQCVYPHRDPIQPNQI